MKFQTFAIVFFVIIVFFACSTQQDLNDDLILEPYPEEAIAVLNRGLVALPKGKNKIYLSWRLLPGDPKDAVFEILRREHDNKSQEYKLIAQTKQTSYLDQHVKESSIYSYDIRQINNNVKETFSKGYSVAAINDDNDFLVFDLGENYRHRRVVTGDLTGDGDLEVVVAYSKNKTVDPYKNGWEKSKDTIKISAFYHTGEKMWTIDLGWGIEVGPTYSPIVVWDIDADGRAEVILKTNKSNNPLDYGQERITILNGETGKILREAEWPVIKGHYADDYNNNSRNYIAVAHLDGKNPTIIVVRGLYKTQIIWAYDSKLNKVWERVIGRDLYNPIQNKWLKRFRFHTIWNFLFRDRNRGSHILPIADVNEDGAEEILWGEHCIGAGGKDLWKVKDRMPYVGHPDIVFAADVIPSIKGKEVYYCREGWRDKQEKIGMLLVDSSGKTIWAHWGYTHIDGGWVGKLFKDRDGMQCYGFDVQEKKWSPGKRKHINPKGFLWDSDGKLISSPPNSWIRSFPIDWNGDGVKEICLKNGVILKSNGDVVAKLQGVPIWGADLFGDHREEVITKAVGGRVYIYFNTQPMLLPPEITSIADRKYKNDLSRTAMDLYPFLSKGGYISYNLQEK